MDLKQLIYIVKIAEENSITKAAEGLFISQSGLNQQLLKLEAELGIRLFHRSKNYLHLTEAGAVYVDYARQILLLKQEAYAILNDMADNKVGHLSVGLTPERGINMFMSIYPLFYEQFPSITIEPKEITVRRQQSMISQGYLDIGFVTLSEQDKTNHEYIHIYNEDIILAIPLSHPLAKKANPPGEPLATADLRDFKDDRFVIMHKDSSFRPIIDSLFEEAGYTPNILFETGSSQTLCNTVKNHLACTLIARYYATTPEDMAYFILPSRPHWEFCAAYKKGRYLTKAGKTFIDLAIKHYRKAAGENKLLLPNRCF